jgi:hypothetical protein
MAQAGQAAGRASPDRLAGTRGRPITVENLAHFALRAVLVAPAVDFLAFAAVVFPRRLLGRALPP